MLAFVIKSNLQYCEALKLSSGDALRRENEEGESVGRSLTKLLFISRRGWEVSAKIPARFSRLRACSLAPTSILWHLFGSAEHAGCSPGDGQGCSTLTLLHLLETSPALRVPLLLSHTDVFCLEVRADGMNSFISTA